jgi:hypothetical protein
VGVGAPVTDPHLFQSCSSYSGFLSSCTARASVNRVDEACAAARIMTESA